MIVWIKKESTGRPNDQRAEVLNTQLGHIVVRMLGDDQQLQVPPSAVCGAEIHDGLTLFFDVKSTRRVTTSCPQ